MTIVASLAQGTIDPEVIEAAVYVLRQGGLVAYPTDTVYGVACSALVVDSLARLYDVTGRPFSEPLPVQIGQTRDIGTLAREVPHRAQPLIDAYFPGPLTLVFHRMPTVSLTVTGGRNTVGIRMPDHPLALSIIRAFETPVVCPPACLFGRPLPISAADVLEDLDGKVDLLIDGGTLSDRTPSTVVDVTQPLARIIREGRITRAEIAELIDIA
jgi:L-threonylcarbamoyladenylate synthase